MIIQIDDPRISTKINIFCSHLLNYLLQFCVIVCVCDFIVVKGNLYARFMRLLNNEINRFFGLFLGDCWLDEHQKHARQTGSYLMQFMDSCFDFRGSLFEHRHLFHITVYRKIEIITQIYGQFSQQNKTCFRKT